MGCDTRLKNNDVPIEAVLKYIVRDRDHYKAKLEQLIPYTKSLEQKLKDNETELLAQASARIKELQSQRDQFLEELSAFREDNKQTAWYIQLEEDRKRLRKENKALRKALNAFLSGQKEIEDGEE